MKPKHLILSLLALFASVNAFAWDNTFISGGIYYNPISSYDAEVICNPDKYKGIITIPITTSTVGFSGHVTSIGVGAFEDCSDLTSVLIPYSVTSIGQNAFKGCSSLTYVNFPYGVNTIGTGAFAGCRNLTSITIPRSVTNIENSAFYDCNTLTSVRVESDVPFEIWSNTFSNRYNATLYVPAGRKNAYKAARYWREFKEIVEFPSSPTITIADPAVKKICSFYWDTNGNNQLSKAEAETVTTIGEVFLNSTITSFSELPNFTRLTSISERAFKNCSNLTSILIPDNVTSIGEDAFEDCTALTSVHITDLAAWCNISFGAPTANPLHLAHHLYLNGQEITNLVIPEDVTCIADYAFTNCSGLTSVTIPNSVTSIGEDAFEDCTALTSVHITDLAAWCKISFKLGNSFGHNNYPSNPLRYAHHLYLKGKEIKDLVIPYNITSIGSSFVGCSNLASVRIPNRVKSIGDYAFQGCIGLTSITIPKSVTSIGEKVFQGCTALTSVTIGNSVTSIPGYAFEDCFNLASITIPKSVTSIDKYAFRNCYGLTSITIPESVTSIGKYAFFECIGLTSVTILEGVTSIGEYAFRYCSRLKSITIPEKVTSISFGAFEDCPSLTSVTIPNSVTSISESTFEGCSGMTSIAIGNSVASIGPKAFSGCSGLTSIAIPNSVTNIGGEAFSGCSGLTSIAIPNSVTSIGGRAFQGCSGLSSVTVPNSVTDIDYSAFLGCTNLTSFTFPISVTSINWQVLSNCTSLTSITIPSSVTDINDKAFYGCSNLKDVWCYASSIPSTGDDIFDNTIFDSATLHVPRASIEKYKKTRIWKNFKRIVAVEKEIEDLSELSNNKQYLIHTRDKIRGTLGVINNHLASNNPTATGPWVCRTVVLDENNPLIKLDRQLSSPYTEPSEGWLAAMIDGDAGTFWHSRWTGPDVEPGSHYFQVEMNDQINRDVAFKVTRRQTDNDHITEWGVYGTNVDPSWPINLFNIATIETPYNHWGETRVSDIFKTGGYKYLRFYINNTSTGRGFGHLAEFQLYPAHYDETREVSPFAIIKKKDGYYLYSIRDKAFITLVNDGNESTDPLKPSNNKINIYKLDGHFVFSFAETDLTINVNDNGVVIDDYGKINGKYDDGNLFTIEEVDLFDPTEALAMFTTPNGDVNGDGDVNSADVMSIYCIMAGKSTLPRSAGDVNDDGDVNSADVMTIYHIMAGTNQ